MLLVLGIFWGSSRQNSDFILRGFWKLCLSFVPLATGVCMQTFTEAGKGGPGKESVLLILQPLLLVSTGHCPPPSHPS